MRNVGKRAVPELDWSKAVSFLSTRLKPARKRLLKVSGLLQEYGAEQLLERLDQRHVRLERLDQKCVRQLLRQIGPNFSREARIHIDDLLGVLTNAAVRRVLSATRRRILDDFQKARNTPREIVISPEKFLPQSVARIASQYQRDDETPGTHWYDIAGGWYGRQPKGVHDFDAAKILKAIDQANSVFEEETQGSQKLSPLRESSEWLADELRNWLSCFEQPTNDPHIERVSSLRKKANDLLEIVLRALNDLMNIHGARPFSATTLVKLICKNSE
jgi:hypothetical protein